MFKVPDWETDIPESSVLFTKKPKNKRSRNDAIEGTCIESVEETLQVDHHLRHNGFPIITNGKVARKKKTAKKKQSSAASSEFQNEDIFTKESEGFELDELLVKVKRKKLNDIKMKEDCEELLFHDAKETKSAAISSPKTTKHEFKSVLTNSEIPNKVNKSLKKRKHVENTNKEINNIIVSAKKIKLMDQPTKNKILSLRKENIDKVNEIENNLEEKFNTNRTIDTNVKEASNKKVKVNEAKKEKIKKILEQSHRSSINVAGNKLRERMLQKLKAAQFRYLNEKLYTSSGNEAKEIFQSDPAAFVTYHQGYQLQVKKWPVNPLDVIVKKIQKMPKSFIVADMGCGEAALSRRVPHKVHSFDLVSSAPGVVACDMARTPLLKSSIDVVVYCLALMGTELTQYLVEANRVLKTGGHLLIAEVESRFEDVGAFARDVERLGFRLKDLDKQHSVFFFMQFAKTQEPPVKKAKLPVLSLKPCLYKRR